MAAAPALTGVLFDFAGTLFAPRPCAEWVELTAGELGVALERPEIDRLAARYVEAGIPGGPYPRSIPAALAASYEARDLDAAAHRAAYVGLLSTVPEPRPGFAQALYERVLDPSGWVPYADARDVVDDLVARGIAVGVISNVAFDIRPILRAYGFDALADRSTLSYEHGATKPDARLFTRALETLGARPSATLMVGDHPEADGGAAAVGMPVLILPMSAPGARHGLDAVRRAVLDRLPRPRTTRETAAPPRSGG